MPSAGSTVTPSRFPTTRISRGLPSRTRRAIVPARAAQNEERLLAPLSPPERRALDRALRTLLAAVEPDPGA